MGRERMGNDLRTKHSISLDPALVSKVERYAEEKNIRSFSSAVEELLNLALNDPTTVSERVLAPAITRLLRRHPGLLKSSGAIQSSVRR